MAIRNNKLIGFFMIFLGIILLGCSFPTITTPLESPVSTNLQNTITPSETRTLITKTVQPSIPINPTSTIQINTETQALQNSVMQLTFVANQKTDHAEIFVVEIYCFQSETKCLGKPKLLFEWNEWISGIDWSPDGKKIVFMSGMYSAVIYIADWNGENAVQITGKCGAADWPKWSPDGSKVAYIFAEGKNDCEYLDYPRIQIFDLSSGQVNTVFTTANGPSRISWLPGGEFAYIAYNSETDRIETIYIVEGNGNIIKQLPPNADKFTHILGLSFSNDGQQIAFVGDTLQITGTETTDIYITDREGNNTLNITEGKGLNFAPVWSPLGDWIAFESNRSGEYEIYVIKPDGNGLMQVTNNNASYPAWRVLP